MSKLPLASIFSAAHASKWDGLPVDTLTRATQSGPESERMPPPGVDGHSNDPDHAGCTPSELGKSVLSTGAECEITLRVAASVATDRVGRSTESRVANMAVKTHTWITLWFILTAPVIFWDVFYCFLRPRSMVGGDLHWIWEPYGLYQEVDYVYGVKALEEHNGFTNAQSFLNIVETALNLAYVYLAHVSSWSGAPLVGFTAATMTLSKTVLYWAQEYYCGGCAVGHNAWDTFLLYWVLPNGLWILFPGVIVWRLGNDITASLFDASQNGRKAASGKTQ